MKHLSTVVLGLLCVGFAVLLFVSKRDNDARHEKDAEAITSASNLLSTCQAEVAATKGNLIAFSNRLEICQSMSLTLSNELTEAKSALATANDSLVTAKEGYDRQATNLNRQITQLETEKQASTQRIEDLIHQIAELTNQIASAQTNLLQANKDYALLENRFRRDVAERVLVERKFNNRSALKMQLQYLQWNPGFEISENRIREGLNVVVKSNLCYVIEPEGWQPPPAPRPRPTLPEGYRNFSSAN